MNSIKTATSERNQDICIVSLDNLTPSTFVTYYKENKKEIEQTLMTRGVIKFEGIQIRSQADFQSIIDSICEKFLEYIDGNSPRTKLSGNVYTSTEYDQTQRITMHNELSYSAKWPNKLFFSCLQPAQTGGETLLVDSRQLLKTLDQGIVAAVRQKGLTYIRNLHGGNGVGPSWQNTFETDDARQVEDVFKARQIEYVWKSDGGLRLMQKSTGIIKHRVTQEEAWFNQIDQFHPFQLGTEIYEAILSMYESPEDFPTYVTFGDGSLIEESIVQEILETTNTLVTAPVWNVNELLIVDNEIWGHGRNAYTGNRKVLVAMSE